MGGRPSCTVYGALLFLVFLLSIFSASKSCAIPAFSRMSAASCSTCHINFPQAASYVSKEFT